MSRIREINIKTRDNRESLGSISYSAEAIICDDDGKDALFFYVDSSPTMKQYYASIIRQDQDDIILIAKIPGADGKMREVDALLESMYTEDEAKESKFWFIYEKLCDVISFMDDSVAE